MFTNFHSYMYYLKFINKTEHCLTMNDQSLSTGPFARPKPALCLFPPDWIKGQVPGILLTEKT